MAANSPVQRRIWVPTSEVSYPLALAVRLPPETERPTKEEHRDLMEGKVRDLLAKNGNEENKRLIVAHLGEGRDVVWGGPEGYAGGLMSTDSMRGPLNEIDWEAEEQGVGVACERSQEELREYLEELTLGELLEYFPNGGWD